VGGIAPVTALIRVDLTVCPAASASPAPPISATPMAATTMVTTATGGLLQSPVPTLGDVDWSTTSTMSTESTTIETAAFLLAASGIKT